MTTYRVERNRNRAWLVRGLAEPSWDEPDAMQPDSLLLLLGAGEVLPIKTADDMHRALYDLAQTHEGVRDGDRFEVPRLRCAYRVDGIHVVAEDRA